MATPRKSDVLLENERRQKRKTSEGFPPPLRVALYARVSTREQQSIPQQIEAMREHAARRRWQIVDEVRDVGSGATARPRREVIMLAARRQQVDVVMVWRLDRWGRSVLDLAKTMMELRELGVCLVSLTEGLDFTTSAGRAMAGMLAVFAEFEREVISQRIAAGLESRRRRGLPVGRPPIHEGKQRKVRKMFSDGSSKKAIAASLEISRATVRRYLEATG